MSGASPEKVCDVENCRGARIGIANFCLAHVCKESNCRKRALNGQSYCKRHQDKLDKRRVNKCPSCDQPRQEGTEYCLQHNLEQQGREIDDFAQYWDDFSDAVFTEASDSAGATVDAAAEPSEHELASILLTLDPSGSGSPASAPAGRVVDSKAICGRMLQQAVNKKPHALWNFNGDTRRFERVVGPAQEQEQLNVLADRARLCRLSTAAKLVQAREETAARLERKENHLRKLLAVCETDTEEDKETLEHVSKLCADFKALRDKLGQ